MCHVPVCLKDPDAFVHVPSITTIIIIIIIIIVSSCSPSHQQHNTNVAQNWWKRPGSPKCAASRVQQFPLNTLNHLAASHSVGTSKPTLRQPAPPPPHPPFIYYTCHIHYTWLPARQALQYKSGPENWACISIKGLDSTSGECENYVGQGLAGETHPICCIPSHKEPQQDAIHGTMQLE